MPLSGENSRHGGGDVIIPAYCNVLVECKLRAGFVHHTLFDGAAADAKKHHKKHPILYTKKKGQRGWLVTLHGDTFSELMRLPQVREYFGLDYREPRSFRDIDWAVIDD